MLKLIVQFQGILPNHVEYAGRVVIELDLVNDGRNGWDCNGHGTHVAGTVGGKMVGVAKKANLHARKFYFLIYEYKS